MVSTSRFVSALRRATESSSASIFVVLVVLCVAASVFSPYFLDFYNLQSIIRDFAFLGFITLGQSLLLILGEIDLSLGKIAAFCGVIGGLFMVTLKVDPYISIAVSLLFGVLFGMLNGLLVTGLRLNSLVVTIGMSGVYGGFNLVFTHGQAITNVPTEIYFLGQGYVAGIPTPFIIMAFFAILVIFFAKYMKTGRHMYAIGDNGQAAIILGIKVNVIKTAIFGLAGFLSAIAGLLMVARLGTSQPGIGETWPLNSIAGSVIGGVALTGGVGTPFGSLVGIAVILIIQNLIVLFGVSPYWQTVVSGIIVVIAIAFGSISKMLSDRNEMRTAALKIKR